MDGGALTGRVGVERHEHARRAQARRVGKRGGLLGGERGAARRHPGVPAPARGGDGDRVERAFHDHRPRSPGERAACLPQPEQDRALPVQPCARAVQVSGHVRAGAGGRAADEGDYGPVAVADREHGAVAEGVDERAAPGQRPSPAASMTLSR